MVVLFAGCLAVGFALLSGGPVASGLCDLFYELPPNSCFSLPETASRLSGLGSHNCLRYAKPRALLSNSFGLRPSQMSDWITGWRVPRVSRASMFPRTGSPAPARRCAGPASRWRRRARHGPAARRGAMGGIE